jgi:2-isopropylmalate synthase
VGNQRRLLVSNQGGKSNVLAVLERLGVEVETDDPRIVRLLEDVKAREFLGYAYESAEASFEILARRALGTVPEYFKVESFRIMVERRHNALGEQVTISEATVKINVGGEVMMSVGEGNGPVNALDEALRKDLGIYNSIIADLELVDYKVRILTGGTAAVTRVLIESSDASGDRWFTVGVSPNIVDASFQALTDSITYKLLKTGAQSIGVQP